MKFTAKWLALGMALLLCLSMLIGCGEKEPELPEDEPVGDEQQTEVPEVHSDTIECNNGTTTLRFVKNEDGAWTWKDDPTFPLDVSYVEPLALAIEKILLQDPIETSRTLEDLGLDSEESYITVINETGHKITWYLGGMNDAGCYYMRRADDANNAVYVSPPELCTLITRSIYDMMVLPQLPQISAGNVRTMTITAGETSKQLYKNSAGNWTHGVTNVHEKASLLTAQLEKLELDGCLDYSPSEGAAAICQLDPPAVVLTVDFVTAVGMDSTLILSIGARLNSGYCVNINDDPTIYRMDPELIDPIMAFLP